MPISKKMEKQNRLNILKKLLFRDAGSIYKLAKRADLSQPTTLRHVDILTDEGLVITQAEDEGRHSVNVSLTEKGLIYVMFNGKLSDDELRTAFTIYFTHQKYPNPMFAPMLASLKKTLNDVKPQVNLTYFDEKYTRFVLSRAFLKNVLVEGVKAVNNGVTSEDISFQPSAEDVNSYRKLLNAWREYHKADGRDIKILSNSLDAYINKYMNA